MKLHPFRAKQVGKHILRERMVAEIAKSPAGRRVIRECQEALDLPVKSDELSRKLVLERFAMEVDLYSRELEEAVGSQVCCLNDQEERQRWDSQDSTCNTILLLTEKQSSSNAMVKSCRLNFRAPRKTPRTLSVR